jgi:hypothetical protein
MPKFTVELDAEDFARLCIKSTVRGTTSPAQASWFPTAGADTSVSADWQYAYWVGSKWSAVILARHYLNSLGHPHEVVLDTVEDPGMSWVILTNYPAFWAGDGSLTAAADLGTAAAWPVNTAVPPAGWQPLTDSDGTQPMGWFTTARDGMRTVVRGYPSRDDAPFDLPEGHGKHPDPENLPNETYSALYAVFDLVDRAYTFPDVGTFGGPATHCFVNLDFDRPWGPPTGTVDAPCDEVLVARTAAGAKPASDVALPTPRECQLAAQAADSLGIVRYRLSSGDRLWIAPARLTDRVDEDALTAAWQALIDADPDSDRAFQISLAVEEGLRAAFQVELLETAPWQSGLGAESPRWDEGTDEGLVTLGAIFGYPPASTYALLAETTAIRTPDAHDDQL